MNNVVKLSQNRMAALEQDKAAGGADFRKMLTKSGGVVTVSLSIRESEGASTLILRFKWGGGTVQRPVGTVRTTSRFEALKWGWKEIREKKIVEAEGWTWVTSDLPEKA